MRFIYYSLIFSYSLSELPAVVVRQHSGCTSSAFVITSLSQYSPFLLKGITQQVEHRQFQTNSTVLYLVLSDEFSEERSIKPISEHYYRYVLTADTNLTIALKDYYDGLCLIEEKVILQKLMSQEFSN